MIQIILNKEVTLKTTGLHEAYTFFMNATHTDIASNERFWKTKAGLREIGNRISRLHDEYDRCFNMTFCSYMRDYTGEIEVSGADSSVDMFKAIRVMFDKNTNMLKLELEVELEYDSVDTEEREGTTIRLFSFHIEDLSDIQIMEYYPYFKRFITDCFRNIARRYEYELKTKGNQ